MGYIANLRKVVGKNTIIMPSGVVIIGDGEGRVLLQKRTDDGRWGYHGGAIEIDESAEDCARREVREELGIELDELKLFGVYSGPRYHHVYPNGDNTSSIEIVYVSHRFHGEFKLQESEVSEIGWFRKDELPENLVNNHKQPILDYLDYYLQTRK